jgi:sensor c-di-GMP phosphodiesterase-like protein
MPWWLILSLIFGMNCSRTDEFVTVRVNQVIDIQQSADNIQHVMPDVSIYYYRDTPFYPGYDMNYMQRGHYAVVVNPLHPSSG